MGPWEQISVTWIKRVLALIKNNFKMLSVKWWPFVLTYWGRVTYICVSKRTTIGSDNGLSPGRRQAIIWPNAGILFIQTLGTNFSEFLREIYTFFFMKMHLKMSSWKCLPSCLGLKVLMWPSDRCASVQGIIIGSNNGLPPVRSPSLSQNKYCLVVNWTLRNKFQWCWDQIMFFIQEHSLKNIVSNTAAI